MSMTIEQAKKVIRWAESAEGVDKAELKMRSRKVRCAMDVRDEKYALRLARAREQRAMAAVERVGIVMPWGARERSALMSDAVAVLKAVEDRSALADVATADAHEPAARRVI